MSKRADNAWGREWSKEAEQDCRVALQVLATSVWSNWYRAITSHKDYPNLVGLGVIHDLWYTMYEDMKAIYTLEQLVNNHYGTPMMENREGTDDEEDG